MVSAQALFEDYVRHPDRYWPQDIGPSGPRRIRHLERLTQLAVDSGRADTVDGLVRQTVSLASERMPDRPAPIYIAGLGGSGSHWLGEMLVELLNGVYAGETYFPRLLIERMKPLPASQQGYVVDCLHLLHAIGHPVNASKPLGSFVRARAANPAGGLVSPRNRQWDPHCAIVYMLRDPRDQVLSVTFRKMAYRQEVAPNASDNEYLIEKARTAAKSYEDWRSSPIGPDFTCRYEELRENPVTTLDRLIAAIGEAVSRGQIADVAQRHDATLIQQGRVQPRGNFFIDDGQGARGQPDRTQKALLHAELARLRSEAGYQEDECLGEALRFDPPVARMLEFPRDGGIGTLLVRSAENDPPSPWVSLGPAAGTVSIPGGKVVRLRPDARSPSQLIGALRQLRGNSIDSLCLAGNPGVDDEALRSVSDELAQLCELDLAKTAISNEGLTHLGSLRQLRGLSLLETSVSTTDAREIGAKNPNLEALRL